MIQLLGDCPPDPYKGSALGRHWILPFPDPYFCTFGDGMATGLKTSSCFDKVASILLPFLVTMSRLLATMSLVWTGLKSNVNSNIGSPSINSYIRLTHFGLHYVATSLIVRQMLCANVHDSAPRYLGPLVAVADLPGWRALR